MSTHAKKKGKRAWAAEGEGLYNIVIILSQN